MFDEIGEGSLALAESCFTAEAILAYDLFSQRTAFQDCFTAVCAMGNLAAVELSDANESVSSFIFP